MQNAVLIVCQVCVPTMFIYVEPQLPGVFRKLQDFWVCEMQLAGFLLFSTTLLKKSLSSDFVAFL